MSYPKLADGRFDWVAIDQLVSKKRVNLLQVEYSLFTKRGGAHAKTPYSWGVWSHSKGARLKTMAQVGLRQVHFQLEPFSASPEQVDRRQGVLWHHKC